MAASIVIADDVESEAVLPHIASILATTPLGNESDMARPEEVIWDNGPIAQLSSLLSQFIKRTIQYWCVDGAGARGVNPLFFLPYFTK